MPTSPQRNALAAAQSDPNLVGQAGQLLGVAGERAVVELTTRMSADTAVATRVKVTRVNGTPAGDLDVVVSSSSQRLIAVFEIKWHIAADGNLEVYKAERAAVDKRKQVARLRGEIASGKATVTWPAQWPDVSGFAWRWFVLTHDVLPTREIEADGVTLRSYQLLSRTLRADSTVADLIGTLDHPPTPPAELCETEWDRFRYGDVPVEIEGLRI